MLGLPVDLPTTATAWWQLFDIYLVLGLIGGGVTSSVLLYFLIKYRDKGETEPLPKFKEGGEKLVVGLVALMAVALVIAAYYSISTIQFQTTTPDPSDALQIRVTGHLWYWEFTYPNGKDVVGTAVIPVNRTVVFNVTSAEVFHNFGIAAFAVKADAIPGHYTSIWLIAPTIGNYTIRCYELCGIGHALMTAQLVVENSTVFQQWYSG